VAGRAEPRCRKQYTTGVWRLAECRSGMVQVAVPRFRRRRRAQYQPRKELRADRVKQARQTKPLLRARPNRTVDRRWSAFGLLRVLKLRLTEPALFGRKKERVNVVA